MKNIFSVCKHCWHNNGLKQVDINMDRPDCKKYPIRTKIIELNEFECCKCGKKVRLHPCDDEYDRYRLMSYRC